MKLLKIENNLGFYRDQHGAYVGVDKITKEDLLGLVDLTLREDVEFDGYSDDVIKHQAHQIVYKSIFEKLRDLSGRRKEYMDESERLYIKEFEEYQK
jgi:hypothetical protein